MMSCFSGSCLMRGCFAEAGMWEDVLLRTDKCCFFWKQPGKRACDVFLECMLERTHDVWKGFNYNPTDGGQCGVGTPYHLAGQPWALLMLVLTTLYGIGLPCPSLLVIVCHDFL